MLLLATVSQVLQFGSMALLARWYSPAEIGSLSQLSALLLFFAPWGALCIPYAFAISQTPSERYNLLVLSRLLAVVFSVIFAAFCALFPMYGNQTFSLVWLFMLTAALYCSAMQSGYQQWFYSALLFALPATLTFFSTLILVIGRVLVGVFERDFYEILALTLVSPIIALFLLRMYLKTPVVGSSPSCRELMKLLKKYRQFPLYQAPQQALNALSQQAPILLFGLWYYPEMTGYYALALACLAAPVALLSKALGDWLYPQMARCSTDAFSRLLLHSTLVLAGIGVLPMIVLMAEPQAIFIHIFGDQWSPAGDIAGILAPWFWLVAVNTPALKALMIMQAQKYTLLLNVGTTILRIGGICGLYFSGQNMMLCVWWLCFCGVVHNIFVIAGAFLIDQKRKTGNFQVTQ